tara:strand:+ start:805 stop:957 length:153 start_codon:yes stop_codon:yes gene_type:complete
MAQVRCSGEHKVMLEELVVVAREQTPKTEAKPTQESVLNRLIEREHKRRK